MFKALRALIMRQSYSSNFLSGAPPPAATPARRSLSLQPRPYSRQALSRPGATPARHLLSSSSRPSPTLRSARLLATASSSRRDTGGVGMVSPDLEVPFKEYSPEANQAYWSTRPVAVIKRLIEVSGKLGVWLASGRIGGVNVPEERAESLRRILTELGPTFIKIGQAVSSRPDTLPPEFLQELEKLQDRLPPFPTDQALAVIEEDLGRPVSDVFSRISEAPIAAASLGQVYRATLRRDGSAVAVKVQRPGVRTSIALDVLVLRQLLALIRRWQKFNSDLPALLDEWAASLFRELNYTAEAANGVRFRELYSHLEGVFVPEMVTDLTTPRVLVMEWVEGDRLRTAYSASLPDSVPASSPDDLRLVEIGVRCSLEQLLEYGFYHADPHPGNLLRTRDGQLAYLDFGMVGQVDEAIRQGLIRATLHLVNREYEALADDFVTLGMLPKDSEKAKIVPALTSVFAEALAGGVNNLSFGDLSGKLGRTMYEFNFQLPSYYILLVRSLSVLEGIALASDPSYKVLAAAYPWVARRLLTDTSDELRATLTQLLYKDGQFNFKRMESLLVQATMPTGRPQRRREDPAGTAAPRGDALALILSPQGDFVRGIIVEELSKGIDAGWRLAADYAVADARSNFATAAAATDPLVSGPLLRTLMDVLEAAPKLADKADAEQVEGLQRLAAALQKATAAQQQREQERTGGAYGTTSTWFTEPVAPENAAGTGETQKQQQRQQEEDPCAAVSAQLEAMSALVQWALREAGELSPAERAEALRLPLEVAQAVSSRMIARAVRWFVSEPGASDPAASASSGAQKNSTTAGSSQAQRKGQTRAEPAAASAI